MNPNWHEDDWGGLESHLIEMEAEWAEEQASNLVVASLMDEMDGPTALELVAVWNHVCMTQCEACFWRFWPIVERYITSIAPQLQLDGFTLDEIEDCDE